MSMSFQEVRQVAETMGRERQEGFTQLLTLENQKFIWDRLVEELLHLFDRFGDFASSALHNQVDSEVMFILSSHFIQVSKLDFSSIRQEYAGRLPLPALEAVSNQLLILAETNPAAYLMAYAMLPVHVFPCQVILEHLPDAPISEAVKKELVAFLDFMATAPQLVSRCEPFMDSHSDRVQRNILNQIHILLETADWLEIELQTYVKFNILPLIS